jgi:hypothetical protein
MEVSGHFHAIILYDYMIYDPTHSIQQMLIK